MNINKQILVGFKPISYLFGDIETIFEIVGVINENEINEENQYIKILYPIKFELLFTPIDVDINENSQFVDNVVVKKDSYKTVLTKTIFDNEMYLPKNQFILYKKTDKEELIKAHIGYYKKIIEEI